MFIQNKYFFWYKKLCSSEYHGEDSHIHHIIPKSLGGTDDPKNLIKLSYRQHFVAHRILLKITSGKDRSKMAFALMRFGKSSRSFAQASRQISIALSGEGNPMFGKSLSEEHRQKISGSNHGMFGRHCVDVWIEKFGEEEAMRRKESMDKRRSLSLSGENNPMFGTKRTTEQKRKQSERMSGEKHPLWGKKRHPTKWMNDGKSNKMVKVEELETYRSLGWNDGRLPKQIKIS